MTGLEARDVNALGLVLVRSRNNLDDLVAREGERRNLHSGAVHEVGIEDAEDGFMSDDKEVVLFALELKNDRLEADCEIMVRLV